MSKSSADSNADKPGASHIRLSPEHEHAIHEAINNGAVGSVDEFIEKALAILSQSKKEEGDTPEVTSRSRLSVAEWAQQFEEWADSFPDAPPISDEALNRKSLYPDRC